MIKTYPKDHDEQLSEHFWLREFHCKCQLPTCRETRLSIRLVEGLQDLRLIVLVPVIVNSAYRCHAHNSAVGGKPSSYHLTGRAADVRAAVALEKLIEAAKRVQVFRDSGIGIYSNRIHVDVDREVPTRWMG